MVGLADRRRSRHPLCWLGFVGEDLLSWVVRAGEGPADLRTGFRGRRAAPAWIFTDGSLRKRNKSAFHRRKGGSMSAPRECASCSARNGEAVFRPQRRGQPGLHTNYAVEEASRPPSRAANETDHTSHCLSGRATGASGVATTRPGRSPGAGAMSPLTVRALLGMIAANHCVPSSVEPIMTTTCHGKRDRAAIFLEMDIRTRRHIHNSYEMGWLHTRTFDHKPAPNPTVKSKRSNQLTQLQSTGNQDRSRNMIIT
jgi:hypothetical protein